MTNDIRESDIFKYAVSTGHNIRGVITEYGIKAIPLLKNAEADFTQLDGSEIYSIINYVEDGIEAIPLLKDAGAEFSKLGGSEIYGILHDGPIETILLLKDTDTDFSKLGNPEIGWIISGMQSSDNTIEAIKLLRDAGARQDGIIDPNKSSVIKELCAPIIQDNLKSTKELVSKLESFLEQEGFFQELSTSITSINQIQDIFSSNVELQEAFLKSNPEYVNDIPNYYIATDGTKVEYITVEQTDKDPFGFPVTQGKMTDYSKVIDCEEIILDAYWDNQFATMLNKHGFNIELSPEQEYTDSQIEELYLHVDFSGPVYSGHDSCQEYAGKMSGEDITTAMLQYCPVDAV